MVKLRLQRFGMKKRPYYRLVAATSQSRRDGRFIERLGHYDPALQGQNYGFKEERVRYWISQGAQPTKTVRSLLAKGGLIDVTK